MGASTRLLRNEYGPIFIPLTNRFFYVRQMTRTSRRNRRKIVQVKRRSGDLFFQTREAEFKIFIPFHAAAFVVRHDTGKRALIKACAAWKYSRHLARDFSTMHVTGIKQLRVTPFTGLT
jgi:hypothetical protein